MSTSRKNDRLVWVDMEMTGLDPQTDRILEIAMIVTDADLNLVAEGPVLVIHQSDELLDKMDAWNKGTHGRSGLIDKVKASTLSETEAEQACLQFLKEHVKSSTSPMCGNTIHQDRRFMVRYMPKLESYFHYRNIDVSTVKELCKRWHPEIGFQKKQAHTALADILESVDELRYYRDKLFIPTLGDEPIAEDR
ncbi:MAG: oligoribonuclease [Burkholderiaceae bacterium]|nr:oligoribonuclease [Burkholderiaceae bacterium]